MGVTDRLGPIRRAGAEDVDGVVVGRRPVAGGGAALARSTTASGRVGVEVQDGVGAEPLRQERDAVTIGHREAGGGQRHAASTSSAFQAGFSSTGAAPSLLAACTSTTNSGRFEVIRARRSPGPTPWTARWRAAALLALCSSA